MRKEEKIMREQRADVSFEVSVMAPITLEVSVESHLTAFIYKRGFV